MLGLSLTSEKIKRNKKNIKNIKNQKNKISIKNKN
jgi:hypothetical protein